uniref:Putative secreted protein n=1 Tax=Ixodes ricinus TaxID=34613 RepID=A0A6B0UA33_IXORI
MRALAILIISLVLLECARNLRHARDPVLNATTAFGVTHCAKDGEAAQGARVQEGSNKILRTSCYSSHIKIK